MENLGTSPSDRGFDIRKPVQIDPVKKNNSEEENAINIADIPKKFNEESQEQLTKKTKKWISPSTPPNQTITEDFSNKMKDDLVESLLPIENNAQKPEKQQKPRRELKKSTGGLIQSRYPKESIYDQMVNDLVQKIEIIMDSKKNIVAKGEEIDTILEPAFSSAAKEGKVPVLVNVLNNKIKILCQNGYEGHEKEHQLGAKIRERMRSYTWKNFDAIALASINKTEEMQFDKLLKKEKSQKEVKVIEVEFNNYGIIPDNFDTMTFFKNPVILKDFKDPFLSVKSFSFGGKFYNFGDNDNQGPLMSEGTLIYDKKQKTLFLSTNPGTIENHDKVATKKLRNDAILMTIADGCGQSHEAALAAEQVIKNVNYKGNKRFENCNTTHEALKIQVAGFKAAQEECMKNPVSKTSGRGDTTLVQAYIKNLKLTAVAVGDAKLIVLRKNKEADVWECFDLIKPVRIDNDASDSGGRFSSSGDPPELDKLECISFQLQPDDVVLVCSDGVTDCFEPEELKLHDGKSLTQNLSEAIQGYNSVEEIKNRILEILKERTKKEKEQWFVNTGKIPHEAGWGKMDNANFALYGYK